jgi:uncharacterized protein (DUF1778 family)
MPTITFRISDDERAAIEAAAAQTGVTVSNYIRQTLAVRDELPDLAERVEDHERRLSALEEMADAGR